MDKQPLIEINPGRCIGCGLCIKVCPAEIITLERGKAVVTDETCISCGHCAAACACDAISVSRIYDSSYEFSTFPMDDWWLPCGQYDVAGLVRLMASRRSCRNYLDLPVDRPVLEDLVRIGTTAPSGTSSQCWTFTILPTRKAVISLAEHVGSVFVKLNRLAENMILRKTLKLFGRGELDDYFEKYYSGVKKALDEWKESGRDRLFHGATAVIIVAAKPGASCPAEDALLATQNMLLAAHAMGLGTCLIGFAVAAMARDADMQCSFGMTSREKVYSVIAIGHPDESYEKVAGRKKATVRYFEG
jgi:nitroreductase/NAD-dependent dihydropyrimidine dehydrogenase PreA subunit